MFMYTICNSAHLDKSPIWEHDDSPKEIMDKILGNTLDRHSFFSLCPDCERRSRSCTACKRKNSPGSLHEMEELRQLQANVKLMPNPDRPYTGDQICMAHYPLDAEPSILYGPEHSNSDKLKGASTSLYKRLHRKGLLVDFHQEVLTSIIYIHGFYYQKNS